MDNKTYRKEVLKTASAALHFDLVPVDLLHGAIGASGEAGEVLDAIKKTLFYGKPLNKDKLIEEIGDVFWYLTLACEGLGTTLDTVMSKNIAKLRARYPDEKFDSNHAINRNIDSEKRAMK